MKDTISIFVKSFENKVVMLAAIIAAVTTIGGAIVWAIRYRPVLKPTLDYAIQGAKDYSDFKLNDHEKIEHAFIHSENLETQNRVLGEILRLEELHHKSVKQSKHVKTKDEYFEEDYNDAKSADQDALEVNQMVLDSGEKSSLPSLR